MSPTIRLLLLILLVGFIAYRTWSRWQGAKAVSEGDEAARLAWKEGFQRLQQDPRFLELKKYAESQVALTIDVPTDDRYQLVYATIMDEKGATLALQDIEQGTFLILYVKGKLGRKQFALNLRDHSTSTTNLNAFAFQAVVPPWAN